MKLDRNQFYRTTDGAYLYYEVHGSGTPLLMMHGWSLSARVYERNLETLSQRYQVIAFDYRGCGRSSKGLDGHNTARYAADARELAQHLGIGKFFLLGWSLGVTIALKYVEQFGDGDLLGVILVDGACDAFADDPWNRHALKGFQMDALVDKFNRLTQNPIQEGYDNAKIWFKDQERFADAIELFAGELAKTPIWISYAIYNEYMMQDTTPALRGMDVPVLVIVPAPNIERGKYEAETAKHGEYVVIDAAHAMFYEKPEEFHAALLGFMDRTLAKRLVSD